MVRHSISFETRPIPMKIAIRKPNTAMAVSPRLIRMISCTPTEMEPRSMAAPIIRKAKTTRLYRTRSRTDSLKAPSAMVRIRFMGLRLTPKAHIPEGDVPEVEPTDADHIPKVAVDPKGAKNQ